jgi:bifunctional UDP-N-acetylglucosamine pyrophosphorylase/glucosamine-1-phosphate N-acetyltransferase
VEALDVGDPREVFGVNSRAHLAQAAALMRAAIAERHMENGVTIVDPSQTFIDADVRIGRDTTILPLTFLSAGTRIGEGCEIGPSVRAAASTIRDGARVQFAVLDRATVGPRADVGPFAYLRPGARLEEGAKAGTYVEIKNSRIGKGSKVPHLSYIGDAELGEDVNIGAGTITCNFDGFEKHRTVVGDGARIGSDTMLVAPVQIGQGAFTGAGSAIAQDVPPGALGIERTAQRNVEGYADRKRAKAAAKKKRERGAPK